MRTSPRSRTLSARLVVLSAAAGAVALVGLGSAIAGPAPTTSSTTSTSSRGISCETTSCETTPPTTEPPTTEPTTSPTTTEPTTATTAPVTPSPGPPCPGTRTTLTPLVCIPTGSGEDQPAPIGTDGVVEFAAQVVNNGPAVGDATVVIDLPAGLRLESDENDPVNRLEDWWSSDSNEDGTPLACTANGPGSVITCATGSVPAGANFLVLIDLANQTDAVAGTSGTFTVTLQSSPDQETFPTTSVQASVDFVGTAHLQVHLTPTKATIAVGQSRTFDATVHNVGPNTAVEAAAIGFVFADNLDDQPFLITNSEPLPGGDSGDASAAAFALRSLPARFAANRSAALRHSARFSVVRSARSSTTPSPIGFWPIGTIAPGATASVQVVVKAESVGQAELDFDATSADESCDGDNIPGCENTTKAELTAVAAVTTTVAATTSTQASAISATGSAPTSAAALPNTGFRPSPWLNSAGAVIVLGIGLMVIGAPRRRTCGRYR